MIINCDKSPDMNVGGYEYAGADLDIRTVRTCDSQTFKIILKIRLERGFS